MNRMLADLGQVTVYVVRDPLEGGGAEHEPNAAEVWHTPAAARSGRHRNCA